MPNRKLSRRPLKTAVHSLGKARHSSGKAEADGQHDVREYIAAMAVELAEMAYLSRLDALAVACDVVREIAEGNVKSQHRHVEGPVRRAH